ncbi:hypothetical protein [Nocardia sp. CY41]|nr:hypothetical protein [Nocardia sp. CY41]
MPDLSTAARRGEFGLRVGYQRLNPRFGIHGDPVSLDTGLEFPGLQGST